MTFVFFNPEVSLLGNKYADFSARYMLRGSMRVIMAGVSIHMFFTNKKFPFANQTMRTTSCDPF